jgi:hypothetical protein
MSRAPVNFRALVVSLFFSLGFLFSPPSLALLDSDSSGFEVGFLQQLEFPFVPDATMTTGSVCNESDPDFERRRYEERIPYCKRNVSGGLKKQIYRKYQVPAHCQSEYTIDHFIPLAIGGTNRADNLWPEHKSIKALRQDLEWELYKKMDQGKISQQNAIQIIVQSKLNPPIPNATNFEFCQ